ncbi:hypothetical protein DPMN_066599 [Dreissena polymorpha]|uniref:Uncharacterized protein n=1 Tax=Dreissena polymorpha TaxID=45954 RepID=A0A9D3YXP1_DREPO|nr:hypothetical protein DPMN_066599 [Dreissena polymorpha]
MATPLSDEGLQNWVKAWMAQKCFKQGILPFIKQQMEKQFNDNISHVKRVSKTPEYTCNTCDVNTIKPYHAHLPPCKYSKGRTCACKDPTKIQCRQNGSCGILYDYLKDKHSQLNPNWSNSRSQCWSTSAWEQMKCYIFTPGYEMQGDIEDTDVTALVQICTNNKDIKSLFVGVYLGFIIQIREDRNELCHSSSMNVDTTKLMEYVDHVKTALQINVLKGFPEALTQSRMLDKLLTEDLTKIDEIESRREVLREIDKIKKELEETKTHDGSDIQADIEQLRELYDKHSKIINGQLDVMMKYAEDGKKEVQAIGNDMSARMKDNSTALADIKTTLQQHDVKSDAKSDVILAAIMRLEETLNNMRPIAVHVPDQRMAVTASTQTTEQANEVDDLLVETGNCILQTTTPATVQSQHLLPLMQHAFDEIGKVGNIKSVKKECMAVYINFPTLKKLIHFMQMYYNGTLSELFQPVQDYLREHTNGADITLHVTINEEDTVKSLISIVEQLNDAKADIDAGPLYVEGHDNINAHQDRTKETETQFQQELVQSKAETFVKKKMDLTQNLRPPAPYKSPTIPPYQEGMFLPPGALCIPTYPHSHMVPEMHVPQKSGKTMPKMQGTPGYTLATGQLAAIDPSDSSAVNATRKGLQSVIYFQNWFVNTVLISLLIGASVYFGQLCLSKVSMYDATRLERQLQGELLDYWHEKCEIFKSSKIPFSDINKYLDHRQDAYGGIDEQTREKMDAEREWVNRIMEWKFNTGKNANARYGMIAFGLSPDRQYVDCMYGMYKMHFKLWKYKSRMASDETPTVRWLLFLLLKKFEIRIKCTLFVEDVL